MTANRSAFVKGAINKLTDKFSKLNPEHELFNQLVLKKPIWWENIKKNKKTIYVDVRKDNYLDVYYNGGAILNLSYANGFKGKIHFEYIPLVIQGGGSYVPFRFLNDCIEIDTRGKVDFAKLDNFSVNGRGIRALQKRIGNFFPPSSEKGIQADFVLNNSSFLDTEFQYTYNKINVRFDLIWVDVDLKKLFVVELKTIGDPRLYFNDKSRESMGYNKIDSQLIKYQSFLTTQNQNLVDHYKRVFEVKKRLDILPDGLRELDSLDGFQFEEKPILLIGDCTQDWIDQNKTRITNSVKDVAYGCFCQGENTRRFYIPKKDTRNKWLFTKNEL